MAAMAAAAPMVSHSLEAWGMPNQWKPGGRFCTQAPCVTQRSPSRRATMAARVTTMEGIRTQAISTPLIAPSNAPVRVAAMRAANMGNPEMAKTPAATLQMANCEPTEISISAVITISVIPTATIRTGTLASSRSRTLAKVKKAGATAARIAAMARMATAMESSRCRLRNMVDGTSGAAFRSVAQRQRQEIFLRGFRAREYACDCACMHHGDAIAHSQNFRQLRRDHDNRHSL